MTEIAEPRRLTPTERLHEVTMSAITRAAVPPEHSVEISRNAKGAHQYAITIRGYDLAEVTQRALDTQARLDEMLPYPENGQ